MPSSSRVRKKLPSPSDSQSYRCTASTITHAGVFTSTSLCASSYTSSYTTVLIVSSTVSMSSIGDSTELVVLCDSVVGLGLQPSFISCSSSLPASWTDSPGDRVDVPVDVARAVIAEMMVTWSSPQTEWSACCSCCESWGTVNRRMMACKRSGVHAQGVACEW